MIYKTTVFIILLIITGCSVFPSTTTLSATSKATSDAIPTVKVQQNFKWSN
jgi:hypothetical protein